VIAEKVLKIQNKAKSLMWGCTRHSETEYLFAVGHKSYPLQVLYFIIDEDYAVSLIDEHHKRSQTKQFDEETELLGFVCEMLKTCFPVKEVKQ
jgi:hypothetical protein